MPTATLQLTDDQVVDLVRQLSPTQKTTLLRVIIPDMDRLDTLVDYGDQRMRELCAQRGIEWDLLGEAERQTLIDNLLHES
jgi:hypothetical protein